MAVVGKKLRHTVDLFAMKKRDVDRKKRQIHKNSETFM
jgi:hypothetical protein